MNEQQQLRLQAFLDGELPEKERREVAAWVERDEAAARLLAGLKAVHETLVVAEPAATMPESREFFWSRIEREIQRCDREQAEVPFAVNWRRWLWPVGAMAAFFLVVMLSRPAPEPETVAAVTVDVDTPIVETAQPDEAAATYCDKSSGVTLVWFSTDEQPGQKSPTVIF